MSRTPRITVLMPVRDGQRWLREAADSVLQQTFPDFELLVVDDGSVDDTPVLLRQFADCDSRVRILRQDARGLVHALNHGLCEARGALIARLDADDIALPDRLAAQASYFDAHPATALLGSWADVIDENSRVTGRLEPETRAGKLARLLGRTNPFVHSSTAFPAALARRLGGYRAAFEAAEDYDLWLRMSEAGEIANLPALLVRYRVHEQSVTSMQVVRQLFSSRLARRAAACRRQSGIDPANSLTGPPDWLSSAAGTAFYSEDARICRFLALADVERANIVDLDMDDLRMFDRDIAKLSHREREIAQIAMMNLRARGGRRPFSTASLLVRLFRLHPLRASVLLWQSMFSGARRPPPPSP